MDGYEVEHAAVCDSKFTYTISRKLGMEELVNTEYADHFKPSGYVKVWAR